MCGVGYWKSWRRLFIDLEVERGADVVGFLAFGEEEEVGVGVAEEGGFGEWSVEVVALCGAFDEPLCEAEAGVVECEIEEVVLVGVGAYVGIPGELHSAIGVGGVEGRDLYVGDVGEGATTHLYKVPIYLPILLILAECKAHIVA